MKLTGNFEFFFFILFFRCYVAAAGTAANAAGECFSSDFFCCFRYFVSEERIAIAGKTQTIRVCVRVVRGNKKIRRNKKNV